ncbi:type III pantothenate kinase [Halarcobacter bivalviorum]|uniref:Type III pantothenate kinase n=1 Tax=Halarcobacter bivalviorum TaxID=663364 RepID=A0AAX2ABX6_9BACT|nr:type III pantothenate kinase [Halarcobacter bivalviorum]AXH13145.1 pantothenate kinase, type III [Halarcobacter bivalviorum]RXK10241.1 pantothenate kinase [Halarcobacter bivalviorum]
MILCDIGNTTFHFNINGEEQRYLVNSEIPDFKERIYYISVNENATAKLKHKNDDIIDLEPYLEFKTKYVGMGLDRKIACCFLEDTILVDAGSAITVDIMKKKKHKGGFILPGLKAFRDIYPQISHKLDVDLNTKVNLDKIPLCTKDAISYAILKSIIEPIKKVSKKKQITFTGGDGEFLSKFFDNSIYKKDIIFENMRRIIDANNCIT